MSKPDVTNNTNHSWTAKGYPRLARLMGAFSSVAIVRRFGALNSLNLLSLQAELLDLEERYKLRVEKDNRSTRTEVSVLSEDFFELHRSDGKQSQLLRNEIRPKLKEYNELVLQLASIERLERPDKTCLRTLQDWLVGAEEGNIFLRGTEHFTWDDQHRRDFITLQANKSADKAAISQWLSSRLVSWYYRWRPPQKLPTYVDLESGRIFDSDESKAVWLGRVLNRYVSTVVASLIPALAILALNAVLNTQYRIFMTIAFTAVFGICLAAFTNASLKEVYTATATFAAVEVVFIGSAVTSSS